MKIVVVSDLHLDAKTAGYPRFDDVSAAIDQSVETAIEEEADLYVCLGDVCDPDESREHRYVARAVAAADRLAMHDIPSRWLAGNHDVIEDGHGSTVLDAMVHDSGHLVQARTRPMVEAIKGVWFVWLPYTATAASYDTAEFVRESRSTVERSPVVVCGHLNIEGIGPGSETKDMPRGRDVFFPLEACIETFGKHTLLLNGHYHKQQCFEGIWIPGSVATLTFGEEGNVPGYLMVSV